MERRPQPGLRQEQPGSWCYNILAYMELQTFGNLGSGQASGSYGLQAGVKQLHQSPIPGFHCPSRRPAKLYLADMPGMVSEFAFLQAVGQNEGVVKTDYAASSGDSYHSASASFRRRRSWYFQPVTTPSCGTATSSCPPRFAGDEGLRRLGTRQEVSNGHFALSQRNHAPAHRRRHEQHLHGRREVDGR